MAIYHLSVKTFSRSNGQSATAAVAYRAGAKIECEREGRTHDYTKKGGVLHSEIFLPDNAPDWANDRQKLWNEAEKAEKRKNSTVAREFEVALPYELNEEQRIALVQDFAKQIVDRHGCAVDAHLHDDDRRTVKANHHAHIMLTTRKLEKDGFTKKTRELDQKKSGEVVYWREQWAKTVNEHLRSCGIEKTVDHRSLKEQGLERQPTIKLGINATALERKGIKTEKGEYNRAITAYNPDKLNEHLTTQFKQAKELHNKINFIKKRLPEVKRDIAEKQPDLYQALDNLGIETATDGVNQNVIEERVEQIKNLLVAKAELGQQAIVRYEKILAEVAKNYQERLLQPMRIELNRLKSEYQKAKKPFTMRTKTWSKMQLDKRSKIIQLEKTIAVREFQDKARFEQEAKDWIAKNKPQVLQAAQQGREAVEELNKFQTKKTLKSKEINVMRDTDKGMER